MYQNTRNKISSLYGSLFLMSQQSGNKMEVLRFEFFKKQVTFVNENMISTNILSVFLLHHHINRLRNKNLHSIQDVMCASKPASEKFKRFCEDFPNLSILTKSSTLGKIQLTFGHAAVGKKSLRESVVDFVLAGNLSSPSVISFKIDIAFAGDDDKIHLPIAEVLLRTAAGDLTRSKKQKYWTSRNAAFLMEAAILQGKLDAC